MFYLEQNKQVNIGRLEVLNLQSTCVHAELQYANLGISLQVLNHENSPLYEIFSG